jgi:hypothetical protein
LANRPELVKLQKAIVKLAHTEEGVRNILWDLMRSDWEEVFKQDLVQCEGCAKHMPRRDMLEVDIDKEYHPHGWCCQNCYHHGVPTTCFSCKCSYVRKYSDPLLLCYECRAKTCCICKRQGVCDKFRIVCHQCLSTYHLENDWEQSEKLRIGSHETRARSFGLLANLPLRKWAQTLIYFDWKCAYCQGPYQVIEHFVPVSRQGATYPGNCVPACRSCNGSKGYKMPTELTFVSPDVIEGIQKYLSQFP